MESLKETNIIETKQQKSKSNRKSKVVEYTIFEDKFQMLEYTTFKKSELLVSYSMGRFEITARWPAIIICTSVGSAVKDMIAGVDRGMVCGR